MILAWRKWGRNDPDFNFRILQEPCLHSNVGVWDWALESSFSGAIISLVWTLTMQLGICLAAIAVRPVLQPTNCKPMWVFVKKIRIFGEIVALVVRLAKPTTARNM